MTDATKHRDDSIAIEAMLPTRTRHYGEFTDNAKASQNLKMTMRHAPGWGQLADHQKEALDLIATKIARILCGDANLMDSWQDIAGYAILVKDRIRPITIGPLKGANE